MKALAAAGADARLTSDRGLILDADGLVVPGVGAFRAVMEALRASRGDELIDRRLAGGRPVLGICVGMQVLFERGVERGVDTEGLGEWPGVVTELDAPGPAAHGLEHGRARRGLAPVPRASRTSGSTSCTRSRAQKWLLDVQPPFPQPVLTWCDVRRSRSSPRSRTDPLSATQFHPEKSGDAGIRLLANWIDGLGRATL